MSLFFWIYNPSYEGYLRIIDFQDKVHGRAIKFDRWGSTGSDGEDRLSTVYVMNEEQICTPKLINIAERIDLLPCDEFWDSYAVCNSIVEPNRTGLAKRGPDFRHVFRLKDYVG